MDKRRRVSKIFESNILGISLHTLFEIFCFAGFLIQSILVLINYFSFPVLTSVYLEVPEETPLPDSVICFDGAYMVNWTEVLIQYPQYKSILKIPRDLNIQNQDALRSHIFARNDKNSLMLLLARQLTVRQVADVSFNKSELILSMSLTHYTVNETMEQCLIKNVIRSFQYCYIFSCSIEKEVTFSNLESAKSSISPNLLTINLNQIIFDYAPNFFITLVPPNTVPRGNLLRWDTMSIYKKEPRLYKMHYFLFRRKLLPAPYVSNCFDYKSLGYNQLIDMRDTCFNNMSMEAFGVPFHASTMSIDKDVQFGLVKYRENEDNRTFREILNTIVDTCFHLTSRLDCNRKIFFIRPRNPIPTAGKSSIIAFGSTKEPNIRVSLEPRLVLMDVIISIGSISGTWFGFSIAEHVPKIYRSSWSRVSRLVRLQVRRNKTERKVIRELHRRASKRLPSERSKQSSPNNHNNPIITVNGESDSQRF